MMAFYTVKIDEQEEKLLSSADSSDDETLENQDMQRRASRTCFQRMHMSILYIFNALLLASVVVLCISKDNCKDPSLITYSPANNAVGYEEVVFYDMPGEWSPYFGKPTDEKDRLWDQLYTGTGILRFTPEETKRMPNKTVAVPGPEGDGGIYDLEVFHELHCLNAMRKTLFAEDYPDWALYHPNGTKDDFVEIHHSHCIDRLRQGVQCAGNIGANYYYWNKDVNKWMVNMQSTHTCRKFDKLQEWARSRDYKGWDPTVRSHVTERL